MPEQYVRTFGPNRTVDRLGARPNRQLELVEFIAVDAADSVTALFYLDQAAAAAHAEQVNRALREVEGGELVATLVRDEFRTLDGAGDQVGYVIRAQDVAERSAASCGGWAQVRTVIEHPWRDLEPIEEKPAA